MKTIIAAIICLSCVSFAPAQGVTSEKPEHGLVILESSWTRKETYTPPRPFYTPGDEGPAHPTGTTTGEVKFPSGVTVNEPRQPRKQQFVYIYSLKVKNVGTKAVKAVFWEYITTDKSSGAELGRRKIIDYQKVKPRAVAVLSSTHPSPPSNVVAAEEANVQKPSRFVERAEIRCVLYSDGTTWQHPDSDGAECENLREVDRQVKSKGHR